MKIIVLWVKALFLSLFYYRTIGTDKVKGKSVIKNMRIDDKHLWERCILKCWSYLNVIFHLSSGYIFSEANMVLSLYQISDIDKYLLSSNNKIKVLVVIQFYQWLSVENHCHSVYYWQTIIQGCIKYISPWVGVKLSDLSNYRDWVHK